MGGGGGGLLPADPLPRRPDAPLSPAAFRPDAEGELLMLETRFYFWQQGRLLLCVARAFSAVIDVVLLRPRPLRAARARLEVRLRAVARARRYDAEVDAALGAIEAELEREEAAEAARAGD